MKISILFISLFLLYSCEAQPNRPLTAIDKVEKINNYKPGVNQNANNPDTTTNTPSGNTPSTLPSQSPPPYIADPNSTKVLFKGQIFDIETSKPLEKVTLTIDKIKKYETDNEGNFSIPDFPIGPHEVVISKEGYIDYISNMNIKYDFGTVYFYMRKKS